VMEYQSDRSMAASSPKDFWVLCDLCVLCASAVQLVSPVARG
jgi:hypothetical protein